MTGASTSRRRRITRRVVMALAGVMLVVSGCVVSYWGLAWLTGRAAYDPRLDKTLVISRFVDGTETVVGTLQFNESGEPRMSTTGPTPERERLETIWKEIAARESIPLDMTERKEVDGEIISEFNSRLVAKGDADYSNAVWSLLQSRYGYVVDLQQ